VEVDITVYRLKIPLSLPYRLSFGVVREYDSMIVLINRGGSLSWGEATPLPGYSRETADDAWDFIKGCISGSEYNIDKLKDRVCARAERSSFAASAVLSALEKSLGEERIDGIKTTVPLTGIVEEREGEALEDTVEALLGSGYRTLKAKLLGDVKKDAERLKRVQRAAGSKVSIRVDANQSYDLHMAERLLPGLDAEKIELLEQPFKKDDWESLRTFAGRTPIPVMLDESIWVPEDIDKAADCGAAIVKLKLMKHKGIRQTVAMADKARRAGLDVVLGNGVQTDLGCIDECYIYKKASLKNSGEMNGFLKQRDRIAPSCITFKDGMAVIDLKDMAVSIEDRFIKDRYSVKMKG